MRIIQIHTSDQGGGAEIIVNELHRDFLAAGHDCQLWVGRKESSLPHVYEIDRTQRVKGDYRLRRWVERRLGLQNFCSPGSLRLHQTLPSADALIIHSIHGSDGYLNIEALPLLANRQPTFLVLHDLWTLTGHCAYTLDCEKWKTGCGRCPDLERSPRINADGTRLNWLRKRRAFALSNMIVVPTAEWVGRHVRQSPLFAGKQISQAIHNSADLSIFRPIDRCLARERLGLPLDRPVILFLANQGARAHYKDFNTLKAAFRMLKVAGCDCLLLAAGGVPDDDMRAELPDDVVFLPAEKQRERVALCYQAADVFCHVARADVCPLTVIESLACGTPVIATAVGGIPELIVDGTTGFLVPPSRPDLLFESIRRLLADGEMRAAMGRRAATYAERKFNPGLRRDAYLNLLSQVCDENMT